MPLDPVATLWTATPQQCGGESPESGAEMGCPQRAELNRRHILARCILTSTRGPLTTTESHAKIRCGHAREPAGHPRTPWLSGETGRAYGAAATTRRLACSSSLLHPGSFSFPSLRPTTRPSSCWQVFGPCVSVQMRSWARRSMHGAVPMHHHAGQ